MHPDKNPSWSVFIFGYNEETTIQQVVADTAKLLDTITSDYEIVIIDDGSTDGTPQAAKRAAEENSRVRVIRHPVNWGIGRTLADGYQHCKKDVICGIPADGEFQVSCILDGARALDNADLVCFYRKARTGPFVRRFLTQSHRLLNRLFLGLKVRDVNWVKIYRRWILDSISVRSQSPLIETELMAQALRRGARIAEVPSPYKMRQRRGGAGWTGTLWNGVKMTLDLLRFCIQFRFGPNRSKNPEPQPQK